MTANEIKDRLTRYISTGLTVEVDIYSPEIIHIEVHKDGAHACMRPKVIDVERWDDNWYKYYARFLITEWALERYLIKR